MKMPILSVRDKLIGFGTTFTAVNKDVAVRGFKNTIYRDIDNDIYDSCNPEDLTLFLVGYFDNESGVIESVEPEVLVYGHQVVTEFHMNNYPDHKEVDFDAL